MIRPLLMLLVLIVLTGCGHSEKGLNHVILVWFDEQTTAEQIAVVEAETHKLSDIAEVQFLDTGRALSSERPIVDDSFDLGVLMRFGSKEAMERYLGDPRHKAFVEKYIRGKVKRVLVYDF